jgi:dTDP-4-dehydrorhamnose reductase
MAPYRSILITGGGGMLAHALADQFRARGLAFTAVKRSECDICHADAVAALFEKHRPSLLLNCAAHTGVDLCEDEPNRANAINGEAVGTLARYAREYGTQLIHYSTDFVFDGQSDRPYNPSDQPNPVSAYGSSKLLGETRLQQTAPPAWLIIRTAWLFGRHGACFPQTVLKVARSGRPLKVVNDQLGCPTYTVDLAQASLNLVDAGVSGIQHVTNNSPTTWFDFAAATLEEFGVRADLTPVSTEDWFKMRPRQAKRPAYSVLNTQRYTATTGNILRDWRQTLVDYRIASEKEAEISPTT